MGITYNNSIITDGLVLCLDPANFRSYPGSGTVCYDLSKQGNNATLTDGVSYNYAGKQRNLLTKSEQFDSNAYYKYAIGVVANSGIAPDSTQTADFLYATSLYNDNHFISPNGLSVTGTLLYTYSAHVKPNPYTKIHIFEGYNGAFSCSIDLASGIVIASGGGFVSSNITSLSNNWKRVSATFRAPGAISTSYGPAIGIIGYPDSGVTYLGVYGVAYNADAGNSGIFIWGSQFEAGTLTDYQRIDNPESSASFLFDGINDMIRVPSPNNKFAWSPSGIGELNNLSIDFWIKTLDDQGNFVCKPRNGGGEYDYNIYRYGFFTTVNGSGHILSYSSLATGKWEHICAILSSTQKAVYRNGKLNASFTNHNHVASGSVAPNENQNLCIMSQFPYGTPWTGNTNQSVSGYFGPLKIYNRVLSADEVLQNYNATRGRFEV